MLPKRRPDRPTAAFAAALVLAAPPAFAAGAARTIIPFEISEHEHMIVELEINDRTRTTGVVDTAATFAMVDSREVAGSGVLPPDAASRQVNILGVNGERLYPVVHIGSIDLGGLRLSALDAAYSEDMDVPGAAANILPVSAFPGDVLELNFEDGVISLYDGRPEIDRSRYADSLPFTLDDGLIFIPVQINGKIGRALVDTGSNLSYVNSAFARFANMKRDDETTRRLLGITGDSAGLSVVAARKIRFADFFIENPKLMVSDPVLLEKLGLEDEPVMILGLDILSRFQVQFDRRNSRVIFSVPGSSVGGAEMDLQAPATRLPQSY